MKAAPVRNPIVSREAVILVCGRSAHVRVFVEDGLYQVRDVQAIAPAEPDQEGVLHSLRHRLTRGATIDDLLFEGLFDPRTLHGLLAPRNNFYDSKGGPYARR